MEDYYALSVQDANKSGGSRLEGLAGGAIAATALTYTGGVSTLMNPIISSGSALAGAKL